MTKTEKAIILRLDIEEMLRIKQETCSVMNILETMQKYNINNIEGAYKAYKNHAK